MREEAALLIIVGRPVEFVDETGTEAQHLPLVVHPDIGFLREGVAAASDGLRPKATVCSPSSPVSSLTTTAG